MSARRARRERREREAAGLPARTRSGRRLALSPILLGLLALMILLVPAVRGQVEQGGDRDGYVSIVASAIDRNWIFPVTDGEADVDGRVERARNPQIPAAFDTFIRESFLAEDMTTLDPAIWRYDGRQLGIDPRAHLISGAFEASSGWRGSLLFTGGQVEQQILDERGARVVGLVPSRPGSPRATRSINLSATAPPEAALTEEVSFVAAVDGAPVGMASVRRIGDAMLLRVPRRDRTTVRVTVNNDDAAPRGDFEIGWRVLQSGDTLTFSWPGGTRRFQFLQTQPAISQARGEALRVRDATLENFAKAVEAAAGSGSASIQTSLDSRVQNAAQRQLVAQSLGLYGSEGITSFRSAAVLMDGLTGEVAAIPSFPVLRDHLHPSQRGSRTHLRMLERNSNFVRMVAGSTAKVPLAMAILQSYPQLGTLQIQGSTPFRTLLGVDLGTPVPDGVTGAIDFRTFLARSSNKYAAMLMMLGLSDPESLRSGACAGPTNEPFSIGGQQRNCRPPIDFLDGATMGPNGLQPVRAGRPAGQGWANNLYTLFCISPNGPDERPSTPDVGCIADTPQRRAIWRSGTFGRPRLLAAVSPDREGFGLNVVDGIYEDYVMTILGGNRGRWSTIGLAQAFSRILTGKAVTARLIQSGLVEDEEQPQELQLRINQGAQRQVIEGLRAVVTEGTARRLALAEFPGQADGDEFRLFAKTGTPNVAFLGEDARGLLQQFAAAGCGLRLGQRDNRTVLMVGDDSRSDTARAIAARPGCQARFQGDVPRIAALIRELNGNPSALARVTAVQTGAGNVVTTIPSDIRLSEGQGHLLVLMVGRYRPGAPDTSPCSLRTVAINFQARASEDRGPAVSYAISLLRDDATRRWFMGTRCRAQPQRTAA